MYISVIGWLILSAFFIFSSGVLDYVFIYSLSSNHHLSAI